MNVQLFETRPAVSMQHDFSQRDFKSVENEFLSLFEEVSG